MDIYCLPATFEIVAIFIHFRCKLVYRIQYGVLYIYKNLDEKKNAIDLSSGRVGNNKSILYS